MPVAARAPILADALAAASTDPASSSSSPTHTSALHSRTRRSSLRRSYTRTAAPLLFVALLLLLARPAKALFDPGEPVAPSSISASSSASVGAVSESSTSSSSPPTKPLIASPLSAILAPLLKPTLITTTTTTTTTAAASSHPHAIAPFSTRSTLHANLPAGCRRTTSLLSDICPAPQNAELGLRRHSAGLRSELVLCPLPEVEPLAPPNSGSGAAGAQGRRETTWAVSGTVTLVGGEAPGEVLSSLKPDTAGEVVDVEQQQRIGDIKETTQQQQEAEWPEEGADGYWRQVEGVAHWVPAAATTQQLANNGVEGDMSPANEAPLHVNASASASTPSDTASQPAQAASPSSAQVAASQQASPPSAQAAPVEPEADAARAAYSEWSASVGGEGSDTWLSFAQWRAAHEEALREAAAKGKKEERKRGAAAAAAAKKREEVIEEVKKEVVEGGGAYVEEVKASITEQSGDGKEATPIPSTSKLVAAIKTALSAPSSPTTTAGLSPLEPNSIPAIGNPATQLATLKHRWNFASLDCAAVVHRSNPSARFASAVLSEKKDRYMLSPCPSSAGNGKAGRAEQQFIIVELCDEISIDTIVLANYEFFSRMFKRFRVRVARKLQEREEDWVDIGTFRARNVRGLQVFNTPPPKSEARFFRYVRLDFLEHYGSEYYCPVSLLRVYGLTQMDDYIREEEELKREREREAAAALGDGEGEGEGEGGEKGEEEVYEEGTAREGKSWNSEGEDKWKEWDEKLLGRKNVVLDKSNETEAFASAAAGQSEVEATQTALDATAESASSAASQTSNDTPQVVPSSSAPQPASLNATNASATPSDATGYAEFTSGAEMDGARQMQPLGAGAGALLNATRAEATREDAKVDAVRSSAVPLAAETMAEKQAQSLEETSKSSSSTITDEASSTGASTSQEALAGAALPSVAAAQSGNATSVTTPSSSGTSDGVNSETASADFASRNASAVPSSSASGQSGGQSGAAHDTSASVATAVTGGSGASASAGAASSASAASVSAKVQSGAAQAQGTGGSTRAAASASSGNASGSASVATNAGTGANASASANTSSSTSSVASSTSTSQSGSPPPEPPAGRSSSGSVSGHSGSSSSSGGGSESIYRTITKRLNALEANATLSLQYIEHSGQMLREVFARMERRQEERMGEMLRALNASNWRQIDGLKRRQQVDLQQAIFEFDVHRQRTDAERNRLVNELHVLANEVLLEKRFGIAQLILLLGLFIFMALTRGSRAAPLIHSGLARISGTPRTARPTASRSVTNASNERRVSEDNKSTSAAGKRPTHGRSESSTSAVPRSSHAAESSGGGGKVRKSSLGLGRGLAPLREPLRAVQPGSDRLPRSTPANFERTVRRPSVGARASRPAALSNGALRSATTGALNSGGASTSAIGRGSGARTAPLRLKIPVPSSSDFAEMSQEELRSWLGFLTPVHKADATTAARQTLPRLQSEGGAVAGAAGLQQRESTRGREARLARSETITKLAMQQHEDGAPSSAPARVASSGSREGAPAVPGDESFSSDWGTERSEDDEDSTADSGFESESIHLEPQVLAQLASGAHHHQQQQQFDEAPSSAASTLINDHLDMQRSETISPPRTLKQLHSSSTSSSTAVHPHSPASRNSPHLATVFPTSSPRTPADLESDADDDVDLSSHMQHARWTSPSGTSSTRPRRSGSHRERRHTARPGSAGSLLNANPFAANGNANGALLSMPTPLQGFGTGAASADKTPQRVASPLARFTDEPKEVDMADVAPTSAALGTGAGEGEENHATTQ